jgi:hypothetical protein
VKTDVLDENELVRKIGDDESHLYFDIVF